MARPLRIEFLGEEDIFKQGIEQQGDPPTENLETPPDALIQAVSDEFGCGMESILRKGKRGI